jgi:hypothetical protein
MNRRFVLSWTAVLIVIALSTVAGLTSCAHKSADPLQPAKAAQPTPTPEPPDVIGLEIQVRDAETSQPIAHADIQLGDLEAQSDGGGMCTLDIPNGAVHSLQILAPGYERWKGSIDAAPPRIEPLTLQVALEPNSIRGQVNDERGQPLPAAMVTWNAQPVALDEQGRFALRRVKSGDEIAVTHPGYEPRSIVLDGQDDLDLSLSAVSVSVDVRDAMTGQQVQGVSICTSEGACRSTDGNGSAGISPVVSGTMLSAQRAGYLDTEVHYQGQAAISVELPPRSLEGTVRDAQSGEPLSNTILLVNDTTIRVDEQGRYHLPDLTAIDTILVKSPGHKRLTIPLGPDTHISRHDALDACPKAGDLPCVDIILPRFAVHGIYANFNLVMWNKQRMLELIDLVDRSPILNAIVVDIKGDRGYLAFESTDPIVASGNAMSTPRLPLPEFLSLCQERNIYTVARMVIFKDSPLIEARPELAVRHPNGAIFYDREGLAWGDPTRQEVWEYNIAITKEAIRMGFDEVQYDYLRFPSDSTSLAVVRALVYSVPSTLESRTAAIEGFVAAAKEAVDPTPAFLSADLFGYALSVTPEHDMRIGQRLMDLAPHVDYVCPMVYPSTFIPGNLGLLSPSDEPYEVVARSLAYGHARTDTLIRPWLQHYWYDRFEIAEQRRAAEEASDVGWCYWNAGGAYDELFFIPPEGIDP